MVILLLKLTALYRTLSYLDSEIYLISEQITEVNSCKNDLTLQLQQIASQTTEISLVQSMQDLVY